MRFHDFRAIHADAPLHGPIQGCKQLQQRSLAAAIAPHQEQDFSATQFFVDGPNLEASTAIGRSVGETHAFEPDGAEVFHAVERSIPALGRAHQSFVQCGFQAPQVVHCHVHLRKHRDHDGYVGQRAHQKEDRGHDLGNRAGKGWR